MIKFLKTIVSVIILVCIFLPLSQCSMQTMKVVDEITGEVVKPSETIYQNITVSDSLFGKEAEISLESFILPIVFLIPLLLSLLPSFKNLKRTIKLVAQVIFSIWFSYQSYLIVFTIGSPLMAGWVLAIASVLFVVLCLIECIPMKHNKIKNLHSLRSFGRAKSARPF